jgi:hypothetical protein
MSTGKSGKPTTMEQAHAEAYRSYLRSLKESLANLDVDAVDVPSAGPNVGLTPTDCIATFHTWNTFHTFHTWNTWNTVGTLSTIQTPQ